MNLIKTISETIVSLLKNDSPLIVAICGAADLGKSYLSNEICSQLNKLDVATNHLTMDSFLMDREVRNSKGISGYNIESYNINNLIHVLNNFLNGESLNYKYYDHRSGKSSNELIEKENSKILLLDGLHSMNELIMPIIDYSIFIGTSDQKLLKIRSEADIVKRGYSIQYSDSISKLEFDRYKDNIEAYGDSANMKLFLERKWNYQVVK